MLWSENDGDIDDWVVEGDAVDVLDDDELVDCVNWFRNIEDCNEDEDNEDEDNYYQYYSSSFKKAKEEFLD